MSFTVKQLIDRLYREYLTPPGSQPTRARLDGDLTAVATTVPLVVSDGLLTPEEIDLLGEGVIVEVDSELMLGTGWSSPNLTVVRAATAWTDTTATTHSDGAFVYLAPDFTRLQVFDAVADAIVDLCPPLYHARTDMATVGTSAWEVPVDAVDSHIFRYQSGSRWREADTELLDDFQMSSTGKAVQFDPDVPSGTGGWLTTFHQFPRPTAETDDLESASWAIERPWVKIIMIDALATLVGTTPLQNVTVDLLTQLLEQQGYSISDATSLRNGLIALREAWIDRAAARLRTRRPIRKARTWR